MDVVRRPDPPSGLRRALWRLPVHLYRAGLGRLLGGRLMLLTHVGRVSGRPRRAVIEVVEHDARGYVAASGFGPRADWYRNIAKTPDVVLHTTSPPWPRPVIGWRRAWPGISAGRSSSRRSWPRSTTTRSCCSTAATPPPADLGGRKGRARRAAGGRPPARAAVPRPRPARAAPRPLRRGGPHPVLHRRRHRGPRLGRDLLPASRTCPASRGRGYADRARRPARGPDPAHPGALLDDAAMLPGE